MAEIITGSYLTYNELDKLTSKVFNDSEFPEREKILSVLVELLDTRKEENLKTNSVEGEKLYGEN